MKLSLIVATLLSASVQAAPADTRKEDIVQTTPRAGGPHGNAFDDGIFTNAAGGHKRISEINMAPCTKTDHLTYIGFDFRDSKNPTQTALAQHGQVEYHDAGKPTANLKLDIGDYITEVVIRTWQKNYNFSWRTRVGSVKFTTKNGKSVSCGAYSDSDPRIVMSAKSDQALLYMSGQVGDGIDNLVGNFIKAVDY